MGIVDDLDVVLSASELAESLGDRTLVRPRDHQWLGIAQPARGS